MGMKYLSTRNQMTPLSIMYGPLTFVFTQAINIYLLFHNTYLIDPDKRLFSDEKRW